MSIGPDNLKLSPLEIKSAFSGSEVSPHLKLDVFDLAAVAMGIVTPSGYWLRANPAMSELFGYEHQEFLNTRVVDLIHQADAPTALREHRRLSELEADRTSVELRCLHCSGEIFWTRHHLTALRLPSQAGTYLLLQIENVNELKASEALRRRQAEIHSTLIQHLPGVLVGLFDREFRYQLVDGSVLSEHGLTHESMIGRTPWEVAGSTQESDTIKYFEAAFAGESSTFEIERDGRHYQARVIPMPDEDGEIGLGMVVYIDVSDLKAAEASRQRRGEIYRAIVRNLPGAAAAVFDRDLRYLLVDGDGLADMDLTPEMVEGKTAYEFWGDDRRDTVVQHLKATLEGEPQEYEGVINGRDYEIRTIPIREPDGSIQIGVVVNFDITERKLAEQEQSRLLGLASAASEHFERLLESAPDAVIILDADGRIERINRQTERLFGYQREEILGQPVEVLLPERFRDIHIKHRATYFEDPVTRPMGIGMELYGRRKDGVEFPVEVGLSPLDDESTPLVTASVRDISDRKAHELEMRAVTEALAKSNRELEEFASVAAHDLRAPLVTVHGLATILAEDYREELDDEGRHLINRIVANADQMQVLLGDLLDISRIGRSESDFDLVDLAAVIDHVRKHLDISLERRNADLQADVDGVVLMANWTRIVQLFSNLVDNAVKYTPPDRTPRIEITAAAEGDQWRISVADNGVGIPEDHRETVFEMFHRLRPGQDLNPQGSGMGLALVARIVSLHGGQIWIDPDVAEGTIFHILLPKPEPSELEAIS